MWANGESNILFDKENEITFGEVKPPSASNNIVNQALIKLAEFIKGSLDSFHKQFGYSSISETFGIIIGGCCIRLFSMDIVFDDSYRFKQIEKMLLPTEIANFLTIVPVIANLYSLLISLLIMYP
ncbi:hypothetical protein G9A89_002229 [Geosiphon pyriformis]|nr:hypothetical protein G9A89_002229 [Geosiphon pyriformis]